MSNIVAQNNREKVRRERRIQQAIESDVVLTQTKKSAKARGPVAEALLRAAERREAQIRKEATS